MADITNRRLLYFKAFLLLMTGSIAVVILLVENPNLRFAGLLCIAIWAFCRCYYFAFYVVQNYADPGYRFTGLISLGRYLLKQRKRP